MDDPWEKSQTVDPEVRAYVYSLVNAVGGQSTYDDTYQVGDDALAALNDILRWLRLYDEKLNRLDVKRCLAESKLLQNDLLEILALWPEAATENRLKAKLALSCLQLMVPLTWPLELEEEKTTVNHHRHMPYLQLAQVAYKRSILHYDHAAILRTAVRISLPSMSVERRERSKRDESIIRLMLYLFRNLAMITQPQMLPSQGDENEIGRSATIDVFHEQDVFNLLLTVGSGSNDEFQDQDVILLEILFHLLKGVDPSKLFLNTQQVQHEEADELRQLMVKEKAMSKSYNKTAPTRHNRFGTMLWVKRGEEKMSTVTGQTSIVDGDSTLQQMDASKKWNKPKTRGKKAPVTEHEQADLNERTDLSESARRHLRSFVEDFLDSSSNPLFSSLRKAIERETERVGEANKRQYFYLIHWFLSASAARRQHYQRNQTQSEAENTFQYIAAVLDQETFVLLNRSMQRSFDEKAWTDLQATLLAFTRILETVQQMADSKDEEDQEIAENIQNRIFYEESTHERIVQILRGYTSQGFAYLDAVTESVHVFVRMLEKYSKMNADLHIRSKRRSRRKTKQKARTLDSGADPSARLDADADVDADEAEEAAEDEREAHAAVRERKFDFARFSAKFLSQPCVDTYISFLHYYADLSPDQLKRCHRYLYRLAFKHELAVLLFRVDILHLLHRMIKGPGGLDPSQDRSAFKEWEQLIQQVFRRCIKCVERSTEGAGWKEMMVVEMLFSKMPGAMFYLQNGYERVVEKRAPRAPAELEFKRDVREEERIGVAVGLMLDGTKTDALAWVKKELERAVEERTAWQDAHSATAVPEGEEGGDAPGAPSIFLSPGSEEMKLQLFKDKQLRLLLGTLGFQRLGLAEDVDASWVIPSELSAEQLNEALDSIKKAEFAPPSFEDGKGAADMVRNKNASAAARRDREMDGEGFVEFDSADEHDASGSGGEIDESLFPANLREKRKEGAERPKKAKRLTRRNRTELTEAEAEEKAKERGRKEKERNSKIKSALYVTAADDESDDEADAEFFRLEEERRKKMEGVIRTTLFKEMDSGSEDDDAEAGAKKAKKGKSVKQSKTKANTKASKKRKQAESEDEEADAEDAMTKAIFAAKRARKSGPFDDGSDVSEEEDIDAMDVDRPHSARSVTDVDSEKDAEGSEQEDEEEETPSTSPATAREAMPLREVSSNVGTPKGGSKLPVESEDEDDTPVVKPVGRRAMRAGFVIEDDSDEE